MTQPNHQPDPQPDTWSPRSIRITLAVIAAALIVCAFTLSTVFAWPWWALIAVAVLLASAAVLPPFQNPRP